MNQDFQDYGDWKGWQEVDFMRVTPRQNAYYTGELAGLPLKGLKVLELGFGNGSFLAWASSKGAEVYGTEASEDFKQRARDRGIGILPTDLSEIETSHASFFDLIVAFDVLEHLTIAENRALLDSIAEILRPKGLFVARFPNGHSPFGRVHQYGDETHRAVLSGSVINQLVQHLPLRLVSSKSPYRAVVGSPLKRVGMHAQFAGQRLVEGFLRKLYSFTVELSPNIVVRLERKQL